MTSGAPARTTTRRVPKILVAGLLVGTAAIATTVGYQSLASSSSTAASPTDLVPREHRGAPGPPMDVLRGEHLGSLGEADGAVPDGTTAFDTDVPAVANLDPDLLGALRRAATDAVGDGVEVYVSSGWRSRKYQEQLFREAVSKYGSTAEAARWVATPGTSAHEAGDAVDIGHSDAAAWLSKHGARYGLCQIYGNEPWHYELRPGAIDHGCSRTYADPTHDPRMQH
jgi:D-alanyl-D-alanine carboxypeptidase